MSNPPKTDQHTGRTQVATRSVAFATCNVCDWRGPDRFTLIEAQQDLEAHIDTTGTELLWEHYVDEHGYG